MDIDALWEYSDPQASEERFRAALELASGEERLELLTQIARTFSLRARFAEAHHLLDELDGELDGAGPRPRVCYLLERGRSFNSAGETEKARWLFTQAWNLSRTSAGLEGLAVDAAHMLAITYTGSPEAVVWNQRGLALARGSQDRKARALIAAMLNNAAWDLHALGRFQEALGLFEDAQAEWTARGGPAQIQIAKWSVARCLRSLERYKEALAIQRALEAEHKAAGTVDGYVYEEIAENLKALGKGKEARPFFRQAADELGKDEWFVQNEPARLERLKQAGEEAV
jgi:tetratricopeptide (TPR) repeat protein